MLWDNLNLSSTYKYLAKIAVDVAVVWVSADQRKWVNGGYDTGIVCLNYVDD